MKGPGVGAEEIIRNFSAPTPSSVAFSAEGQDLTLRTQCGDRSCPLGMGRASNG